MRYLEILSTRLLSEKCMRYFNLAVFISVTGIAQAQHLDAIGPVYPIAEESALVMIMKKLQALEKTGALAKMQEKAKQRAIESIKNMPPVAGISTVKTPAARLVDPSVTYTKPIVTPDGKVVVAAGTRVNPLEIIMLSKRLVFFDGRDPEQCSAVKQLIDRDATRIKPILIAGSWLDLTKAWKTQVYYDQHGVLSKRLQINAVPSVVSQRGNQLLIQEIPAKELK